MKIFLVVYLFLSSFLISNNVVAQNIAPNKIALVRAGIAGKGIDEADLISRLKKKGVNVETMTEAELLANKAIIEQTVAEIETANKTTATPAAPAIANELDTLKDPTVVQNIPDSVIEKKADEVAATVMAAAPKSKIYGHKMFTDNSMTIYRISKDVSPPDSYILAPGDKINILIFGKSQADLFYEVNAGGFIQPNSMPKIFISGLTLKQAREMLTLRFSTYYVFNKDQFALVLNTSRTITVNIFGEVIKMGSFTTSALNTALNILSVAGGPTDFGSVRNIQIIRGKEKKILDVYDFMRNPILQFEFFLQNNDIVYVPLVEKLIYLQGSVNRPMYYELKGNEGINELFDFAGGLKVDAYTGLIQIESIENNKPILNDYALSDILSKKITVVLKNGDKVTVKGITESYKDFVSISGPLNYIGKYPLNSTPSLKALFNKAIVKPEAKTDLIFLIRKKIDNTQEIIALNFDSISAGKATDLLLQKEDQVTVFEQSKYVEQFKISVAGEIRSPFERSFSYSNKITINEALNFAGGLTTAAADFGYIYRTNPFNAKVTTYIPVSLKNESNFELQPGDQLVVLNKDQYKLESSVIIQGNVNKPTSLRYDASLTIKDLMTIAGGPTISTNLGAIDVFRLNFTNYKNPTKIRLSLEVDKDFNIINDSTFLLQPYDLIVLRTISEFKLLETIQINGEVINTGPFVVKTNRYYFSDLIKDANGFTSSADKKNTSLLRYKENIGIISFDARKAIKRPRSKFDPILVEGDIVAVPELKNVITISTSGTKTSLISKNLSINTAFLGNYSAKWYINKSAGGFTKNADKNSVFVLSPNGAIHGTRHFLFFRKYPKVQRGDKITLISNPKTDKTNKERKPLDWDKLSSKIVAFITVFVLVQQLAK